MTTRILFVCLGNICRSPMAEGAFRALNTGAEADSAGTAGWHIGNPPDARAREEAASNGINIGGQRARQVGPEDFDRFDLIVAMDGSNRIRLEKLRPDGNETPVRLMRDYDPEGPGRDVPDPYYDDRFGEVWTILDRSVRGLAGTL